MADVRRLRVGEDNEARVTLDDLAREGARRMIAAALKAEADEYVASLADEVDEHGRRLVVRNGHARERRVTVGSGTVAIRAPRVNDRRVDEDGERQKFELEDPAGLRAPVAEGQRRAAGALSARPVDRRRPARVGAAAR